MKKTLAFLLTALMLVNTGCASSMKNTLDTLNDLSGSLGEVQGLLDETKPILPDIKAPGDIAPAEVTPSPVITTDYIPLAVADLDAHMSSVATGAASYCMNQDGVNIVHGAVGKATESAPATVQSAYNIQEVSQLVCAAAVMEMSSKGYLNLDAPAVDYLQGFTMRDERYSAITLRQLLSHTSGINGDNPRNAVTLGSVYPDYPLETLAYMSTEYLSADPGALFGYSPINYVLAARAVEQASGVSYAQYVTENIFNKYALMASYHPALPNEQVQNVRNYNDVYRLPLQNGNALGANDIKMSANDLSALGRVLMSAPYYAEMSANAIKGTYMPVNDSVYAAGLGFCDVEFQPLAQMGVSAQASYSRDRTSCLILVPEHNLSVAVLCAQDDAVQIATEFALSVLAEAGIDYRASVMGSYDVAPMNEQIAQNSGVYASNGRMLQVKINPKGELWLMPYEGKNGLTWSEGNIEKYLYRENGRFSNGTRELFFVRNGELNYLCAKQPYPLAGAQEYVLGQQLTPGTPNASFAHRDGKVYLAANNNANAVIEAPLLKLRADSQFGAYVLANDSPLKVVSDRTAAKSMTMPGFVDQSTLYFFDKDGVECAQYNGTLYVEPAAVNEVSIDGIYEGIAATNESVEWFVLPPKSKHYLSFWGNARYVCVNFEGEVFYDSLIDGNTEYVRTPEGGYMAVLGNDRAQYRIAARRMSDGESANLAPGPNVILKDE